MSEFNRRNTTTRVDKSDESQDRGQSQFTPPLQDSLLIDVCRTLGYPIRSSQLLTWLKIDFLDRKKTITQEIGSEFVAGKVDSVLGDLEDSDVQEQTARISRIEGALSDVHPRQDVPTAEVVSKESSYESRRTLMNTSADRSDSLDRPPPLIALFRTP
jgi:hypothetical protein